MKGNFKIKSSGVLKGRNQYPLPKRDGLNVLAD